MKETGYTVKQEGSTFSAYRGSEKIAMGCIHKGDALQAIWIAEGKNPEHKYIVQNDVVVRAKAMDVPFVSGFEVEA